MKKHILFLIMFVFAISCSKEKNKDYNLIHDRLSFKNMSEFNTSYLMLSKMTSKEELQFWAQTKNHSTLLNSNDTNIEQYSNVLKTILNKDSEYELGDSIIWFNNGNLYAFAKNEQANISALKTNPNKCHLMGYVSLSIIENSKLKSANLGLHGLDARNQKTLYEQYYQPCGGNLIAHTGMRKYVHEIYDESIAASGVIQSHLHLRIKLEYQGSKGWKAASELTEINVNVVSGSYMYPSGEPKPMQPPPYHAFSEYHNCSGTLDIMLLNVNDSNNQYWVVSIEGSIYQKIMGDVDTNAWTDDGIKHDGVLW